MLDQHSPSPPSSRMEAARAELAQGISHLAFEIVDVAGLLTGIDRNTSESVSRLTGLRSSAALIGTAVAEVRSSLDRIEDNTKASVSRAQSALMDMKDGARRAQSVAAWVQDLGPRMQPMGAGLDQVRESSTRITRIAAEISMLAINARIEAARAGDEGRGFSVVAEAVGQLSKQTSAVTKQITEQIHSFGEIVATLIEEAAQRSEEATSTLELTTKSDTDIGAVADTLRQTSDEIHDIASDARKAQDQGAAFLPVFSEVTDLLQRSAEGIHQSRARIDGLTDEVERLVQVNVATGARTEDTQMIDIVTEAAARISAAFEAGLESGRITRADLMDTNYRPVEGTDPLQVMTRFTLFTDEVLPPIQEPILRLDPRIVFCAAVDRNGYLPTHNLKFSKPQGEDPVWNAANSRNRRIFDDRVGAKAGKSRSTFLLQVYRRDMGGGTTVLMKDLSAPIFVGGDHWGGLRLAYKPD